MNAVFRGDIPVNPGRYPAGEGPLASTWKALAQELPQVALVPGPPGRELSRLPNLVIDSEEWDSPAFNFYRFDRLLDEIAEASDRPFGVAVQGPREGLPRVASQVLTRCQRWSDRRNRASSGGLFARVLAAHREAHDLARPLVRADYGHALDTWQWVLRLCPGASLALQLAALLHDIERLASEADARREQHAASYQGFKDEHAARGAEMAAALLARAGAPARASRIDRATCRRMTRLIAAHERPPAPGDPDAHARAVINDADALSFFSLNSVGYLDYFGPQATRAKVAYTLRRLSPAARGRLARLRLPPLVAAAIPEWAEAAEQVAV